MSNFTITIDIPALDRICNLLAARAVCPEVFTAPPAAEPAAEPPALSVVPMAAPEPAPAPVAAPAAPAGEEPVAAPEPQEEPSAPAEALPPVALDTIQRAAAELRDQGKLEAIKALFPAFEIRKLSDLKPEQTGAFAVKLKELGANL